MTTAPPRPPAPPDEMADAAGPSARPPSRPPAARGHRLRYAVVGLVLVGSLVFLLAKGLGSALNFYLPANQAVAQRASLGSKTFNLEGLVVKGSIHHTPSGVDFVLTSGSTRVAVENSGSPPELFQPEIPVIAVGHFSGTGTTFVSDQILVKHSADYIAAHPNRVTAPNGTKR
jgi:cytochrome c-type biogenesis protein CcmE